MRRYVPQRRAIASVLFVLLAACGAKGPEPIALNEDGCEYCRMAISDARFGGEAVSRTGRVYKFDSIECLTGWVRKAPGGTVKALYVIDTQHPGSFVAAESAGFIRNGFLKSPMGKSIVAFATPKLAEEQRAMLGGTVLSWPELLADTTSRVPGDR